MSKLFNKYLITIFFFLFFLFIGVRTLSDYGMNWDEPNHFLIGQAYLHFFLTGRKDYNDLPKYQKYYQDLNTAFFKPNTPQKNRRSMYQNEGYTAGDYLSGKDDIEHSPFSGISASFFNYIFFQRLGILSDVDSYNLYMIFTASALIAVLFLWVSSSYGFLTGFIAGLSLFTYPLFLAESHFNVKDVPEAVFYSLTLFSFYTAIVKKKTKFMLISAIFFGISWAIKLNIIFALPVMFLWLLIFLFPKRKFKDYFNFIPFFLLFFPIAFSIVFLSWPTLWDFPLKYFHSFLYYKGMGTGSFDSRYLTIFGINIYPSQWILFTTPLVTLFFTFFGILYVLRFGFKEKNKTSILILLWFILPIARVTVPGSSLYGGVRQIMEFIPAMAILSGIGAKYIVTLLNCYIVKIKKQLNNRTMKQLSDKRIKLILQLLVLLSFIPITLKLISIHPNEGVYFNPLIGGLKGAKEKDFPSWGESLGNPFRQGLKWISNNAEENAKLDIAYGMGSNVPWAWLRPDIDFQNIFRGLDNSGGEYSIALTNKNDFEEAYYLKYLDRFLEPVYETKIDGVPILRVYKNDKEHTKSQFKNESLFKGEIDLTRQYTSITIDLKKIVRLRKFVVDFDNVACKKNADDIGVITSKDRKTWTKPNSGTGQLYILSNSLFEGSTYLYYLAAEEARFIVLDYHTKESCLDKLSNFKIYILD